MNPAVFELKHLANAKEVQQDFECHNKQTHLTNKNSLELFI